MTEGRLQRVKNWLDPRIKTEGAQLKHWIATTSLGLVFGLIVAFWLAFGAFWVGKQTASWVQQVTAARKAFHPKSGVVVPVAPKQPLVIPVGGVGLPPSAGINFNWFAGTDTQGGLDTTTCEAHAFGKALADEVSRMNHKKVNYSKRALFDDVTNGRMIPTSPQWYAPIARDKGVVRNRYFSYGPKTVPASFPPYSAEGPPLFLNSHRRKVNVTETFLYDSPAPGQGGVVAVKQQIARGHPVLLSIPVYHASYENSWYTGYMDAPARGDALYFNHGVVCVRYQDNRIFHGVKGWFLCNNSWGPSYGVDQYGNFNPGHAGYFWYSYRATKQYSLQALYLTVHSSPPIPVGGGASAPPVVQFTPSHGKTYKPPFNPGVTVGGGSYSFWVHDVYTRDTNVNLTYDFNYWGKYYNVWPVGLVATALTESSLHQFAPRCCIPGDTSYGLAQFTLGTACAYGICYDIENRLNNPHTAVQLMARYYADAARATCVQFPYLYGAFNQGPGLGCGAAGYFNPGGVAYSNFQNFLGNYNYAQQVYMGGSGLAPPPKKRAFPRKQWGPLSPYFHGKLSWAASVWLGKNQWLGHALDRGHFYGRKHGYTLTRFQGGKILTWPAYRKAKVVARR